MQGIFSQSKCNSTSHIAELTVSQHEKKRALFKPVISCDRAGLRDTYPANTLVRVAQTDYITTLNWRVSNLNLT